MRVTFRHSGGFAGTIRGVELDTAGMSEPEGRELRTLVEGSGIEGKAEFVSERSRDLPLYEVRILREEGAASLICDPDHMPDAARALLSYLAERARPLPPEGRRRPSEPGGGSKA